MTEKLRACHLIHRLQPGGAEDVLVELAGVAASAGIELSVLALVGDTRSRHGAALRDAGVHVESLQLPTRWDVRGLPKGKAAVQRLAPDVVHTHLKHADLVGSYAARRLGLPHVSTLHVIEDGGSALGAAKRRLAALGRGRSTSRIIAVSDAQRRWYASAFPDQADLLATVHNGVTGGSPLPAERRAALRHELGAGPHDVLVVNAAVMRPGKGHDTLLDAVRQVDEQSPVRVALAGDGELRADLERQVRADPRLAPRVRLLGFRDDVPDLLAAADLLVQPSDLDALPTVLMQAQAAGVPAVGTDVGGIPEIVTPGTGLVVRARDPAALAGVLADLAGSPGLRATMGRAARQRFLAEFDAGVWARRLRGIYQDVCAADNGRRVVQSA